MSHTYTSERIYHFTCSECSNWWSYASEDKLRMKEMTCPHCGHYSTIQPNPNIMEIDNGTTQQTKETV